MVFAWLKRFLPRGLYGRAALILILPIVMIQLVVSLAFLQRHFEDVTRQMTRNIVLEIAAVLRAGGEAGTWADRLRAMEAVAGPLDLRVGAAAAAASGDSRVFYDFSGRVVIATLREAFPELAAVDLADLREVRLTFAGPRPGDATQIALDRRRVSASNPHQLLVLMVFAGLLLTAIAFLFLRNQLRPIRRLALAAEEFGKGRIVPYRPTGATEVRSAGAAFLDMRARIERHLEQRTLMLSGVSHDLRTPLTRMRLGLEMLGDEAQAQDLRRDVDEMQQLLDAFLDFARDDAREEEAEPIDPVDLVRAVVEDARRTGQDATLVKVEGAGTARWRPMAIRRGLQNLIGNAVRYGTRAHVGVAILERSVRITVDDDGPGIPKDRREEAVRPFTRLDAARNQNRGQGVGLGLAITADIARSHGGLLRLGESDTLGGLRAELVLAR